MSTNYSLSSPSLLPPQYRKIGWSGGSISCDNSIYGCTARSGSLEQRLQHKLECQYEPNAITKCDECDSELIRSELKYHSCIKDMRSTLKNLQQLVDELQQKVDQQSTQLDQVKQKLNQLESKQHTYQGDRTDGFAEDIYVRGVSHVNNSMNDKQTHDSNQRKVEFVHTKDDSGQSIQSNKVKVLPKVYTKHQKPNKSVTGEEEVDFGMYGSKKYKYLSQLSRETSVSPLTTPDSKRSHDFDFAKKNKEKLVNIIKISDNTDRKPPVVRLRSWSAREDQY